MTDEEEVDLSNVPILYRGRHRPERKISLSTLRKGLGLSQEHVAGKMEIAQSDISRTERQADWKFSTLRRYAEALGGELLLYVKVGERKYPIGLR